MYFKIIRNVIILIVVFIWHWFLYYSGEVFSYSQGQDVTVSKFMRVWFKLMMKKVRRSLLLPPVVKNTNNIICQSGGE